MTVEPSTPMTISEDFGGGLVKEDEKEEGATTIASDFGGAFAFMPERKPFVSKEFKDEATLTADFGGDFISDSEPVRSAFGYSWFFTPARVTKRLSFSRAMSFRTRPKSRSSAQAALEMWAAAGDSPTSRTSSSEDGTSHASMQDADEVSFVLAKKRGSLADTLIRASVARRKPNSRSDSSHADAMLPPPGDESYAPLRAEFPNFRDAKLRRFLKEAKGDLSSARGHLAEHEAWRKSLPDDLMDDALVELEKRKMYIRGCDMKGRHLLMWQTSLNDPRVRDPVTCQLAIIWWALQLEDLVDTEAEEAAAAGMDGKLSQGALVVDRTNSVLDLAALSGAVPVLQDNFPELLGAIYVCPAGLALRTIFGIISPLLNQQTKRLLKMISSCEELKDKYIAASVLPVRMGGTDDWEFDASDLAELNWILASAASQSQPLPETLAALSNHAPSFVDVGLGEAGLEQLSAQGLRLVPE